MRLALGQSTTDDRPPTNMLHMDMQSASHQERMCQVPSYKKSLARLIRTQQHTLKTTARCTCEGIKYQKARRSLQFTHTCSQVSSTQQASTDERKKGHNSCMTGEPLDQESCDRVFVTTHQYHHINYKKTNSQDSASGFLKPLSCVSNHLILLVEKIEWKGKTVPDISSCETNIGKYITCVLNI